METVDITRHQLILRLIGVSLRARTRGAGQPPRERVGNIEGRLVSNILRVRDGHHDARGRQHQHSTQHDDAHNSDEHHTRRSSLGQTKRIFLQARQGLDVSGHTLTGGGQLKPRARARGWRGANGDTHLAEVIHDLDDRPGDVPCDVLPHALRIVAASNGPRTLVCRRGIGEGISPQGDATQDEGEDGNDRRHDDGELGRDRAAITVARRAH